MLLFVDCALEPSILGFDLHFNANFRVWCTIAHAFEKTKFLEFDIYWKKCEDKYYLLVFLLWTTQTLLTWFTSTFQAIARRCAVMSFYSMCLFLMHYIMFIDYLAGILKCLWTPIARIPSISTTRITLPPPFQDFTVWFLISKSLIQTSTLSLLELIRAFTSNTLKQILGWQHHSIFCWNVIPY